MNYLIICLIVLYIFSIVYLLFAKEFLSPFSGLKESKILPSGETVRVISPGSYMMLFFICLFYLFVFSLAPLFALAIFLAHTFIDPEKEPPPPPEKPKPEPPVPMIREKYEGVEPPSAIIIRCAENPFDLLPDTILYIEDDPDPLINHFFIHEQEKLASILAGIKQYCHVNPRVLYLPSIAGNMQEHTTVEVLSYYFPFLERERIAQLSSGISSYDTRSLSRMILGRLGYSGEIYPGFLRRRIFGDPKPGEFEFSYVDLRSKDRHEFEKKLWLYFSHLDLHGDRFYYQLSSGDAYITEGRPDKLTENRFDYGKHTLAREIQEKIDQLKQSGDRHLLLHILGNHYDQATAPSPFLESGISRLVIAGGFRIFLPGYGNMEVELTPLPKTVFLFFLRHPEGVMLKYLCDHKAELLGIYKLLSGRESLDEMTISIDELTDPTNNSINEKCSRIKEAFLKRFDDRIARNYYVTGERKKEKGIRLGRDLVTWEVDLSQFPEAVPAKSAETAMEIERRAEEFYKRAKEQLDLKNYPEAIEGFTKALAFNDVHFNALAHRAVAHFETGNYRQAVIDNNRAIELHPDVTFAHHNRAEAKLMLKSYKGAYDDVTLYLKKANPKCAPSYFMRGLILMEMKDLAGACQDWFTAHSLGHPEARKYLKKYPKIKIREPLIERRG